jgi:hypothetical protein
MCQVRQLSGIAGPGAGCRRVLTSALGYNARPERGVHDFRAST